MREKYMTKSAFARLVGVTPAGVAYAIEKGRIGTVFVGGKEMIETEKALDSWGKNTDPSGSPLSKRDSPVTFDAPGGGKKSIPAFSESRAIREAFQARMTKLQYDKKKGLLIEKSEVEKEAYEFGKLIRDSIQNIPARVSAEIAAVTKSEPFVIEKILTEQFDSILSLLSSGYFATKHQEEMDFLA